MLSAETRECEDWCDAILSGTELKRTHKYHAENKNQKLIICSYIKITQRFEVI